ncbi:DNA polymerase III subunit delta [Pseudooceanicola sp. CBS1P-1]|uniref:DNA-directed DNA polymerase n=1 Tax=Pseudooceanicola albus TaxID=2692189 RepID=A0A6L7FZR9_9RHOB|nr:MULTISPECIES: DNA polymerase III subunit delta [Pseudooceanicola]MBT9383991.1 DNA polymerase III subunit delta [Pseudooceanicola endophyticus]MXN16597.1 DNA polymerase III subunit delta [Pseudooceanicola albus]
MKLAAAKIATYARRPEAGRTGILLYGPDAMRIALRRQEIVAALVGPRGDEEMRLTRMSANDIRRDAAGLLDAVKAQSFFPGPRVVFLSDATEAHAAAILPTLEDWQPGDAQLVITAGQLKATSKLRKAFENHSNAYACGIYDDPPSREEVETMLKDAGLTQLPEEALRALTALALAIDPGDFRQTVEKIALYKLGDDAPLSVAEITLCAPASTEADMDDMLHVVAEARAGEIGPLLRRLEAQGANPTGLCIAAQRHFRALYTIAGHPDGAGALRPPLFGPRRDRMLRQARDWGAIRLEQALTVITDTDLVLRSAGRTAPEMALVERMLVRLAMLGRNR